MAGVLGVGEGVYQEKVIDALPSSHFDRHFDRRPK